MLCASEICDLALLAVDDDTFWDDVPALPLGGLPRLQDAVVTVGYPATGVNICITSGVTSRIEMRSGYLTVQIDAAINPGNSGGPALGVAPVVVDDHDDDVTGEENEKDEGNVIGDGVQANGRPNGGHVPAGSSAPAVGGTNGIAQGGGGGGGKVVVVGVAFQKHDGNENTGFLIATDVVRHFLADYARNGRHTGSCLCGFIWQTLPDRDFRRYLRMADTDSGVLVVEVARSSPAHGVLHKDDVVLAVDGVSISNAGKIAHASSGERLSFHALIVEKFPGDSIRLAVLRDGERIEREYCVRESTYREIIPQYVLDDKKMPEYCVVGGLVLTVMTEDYVADGYGSNGRNRPGNLVNIAMMEEELVEQGVKQVVLLSKVLNDEINVEYAHIVDQRVHEVDGVKVKSLRHVKRIVERSGREFVRFDLDYEVVVLDREKAKQANDRLQRIHHIPAMSRLYGDEDEDEEDEDEAEESGEEEDKGEEEKEGEEKEGEEKEGDGKDGETGCNDAKAATTTVSTTTEEGENGLGDGHSSEDGVAVVDGEGKDDREGEGDTKE